MRAGNDLGLIYDNYNKIFFSLCDGIVNKLHIFPIQNFIAYKVMCILTLSALTAHKTCCQMSSICLQNFKFCVLLWIAQCLIDLKNIYTFFWMDN